jgi:hypothetical protein
LGALKPADLESSTVAAFHDVEAGGVDIEDRKAGRQRTPDGFVYIWPWNKSSLYSSKIYPPRAQVGGEI